MEKNSSNNHQHQHRNRERIGVLGLVGDHHDDGLLRTTKTTQTPETRSSDFVLQWGNRKRLRCMKIQVKVNNTTDSSSAAVPVHRTTVRVDRRVIRSDTNNNNNRETSSNHPSTTASNGYLNLRQRPPSPSHRILRFMIFQKRYLDDSSNSFPYLETPHGKPFSYPDSSSRPSDSAVD